MLVSDFQQILLVILGWTKEYIINAYCNPLWPRFKILMLKENMCLSADRLTPFQQDELNHFAQWILMIGDGIICDLLILDDPNASFVKIPNELLLSTSDNSIASIVSTIYPNIKEPYLNMDYFKERVIITPKNIIISEINDFILSFFNQNVNKYYRSKVTKLENHQVKITSMYNLVRMNIREHSPKMNIINHNKTNYNQCRDQREHAR